MTAREDWIEAIEEYGLALDAWSSRPGTRPPSQRPQVEDYVGHLLPDDKGVPPTARAVIEAAKAEVAAQSYRSSDVARALKASEGEYWFEEYERPGPAICGYQVTSEMDDGPLLSTCTKPPHGSDVGHHFEPLYRFRPSAVPTEPAAKPAVDDHAYGSYRPEWDGPAVPTKETGQLPPESACDCLIPALEGFGQHSPGCSVFKWKPPTKETEHG